MTGIGIQRKIFIGIRRMTNHKLFGSLPRIPFRCGERQMPRIDSHRKIRGGTSTAGYKRFAKCVLIAADRCPPAENPSTPILCGSMCHSAA